MNNTNYHPILAEPPVAHALHKWNAAARALVYEYNGRPLITLQIPGADDPGFRHGSDGNLLNRPFAQQIYVMLDRPVTATARFALSGEAVNMRPRRAGHEEAILGQVGRPLMFGVNGLYDIGQDLLIDWHGRDWRWTQPRLVATPDGLAAELEVVLGPMPWTINLRMRYYRDHLGFVHHEPWKWRPNPKPIAGWCSWEACRRNVAFSDIETVAEFFGKRLKDHGLEYIQLDDGFERLPIPADPDRDLPAGWLEPNERFPRGHAGVVAKVREHGLTPAIWTNANVTNPAFAEKNAGSFLKDRDGKLMLGEWIDYLLDCSDETLEKHVLPYYRGLRDTGYTYFKTDAIRHLLMDGLQEAVRQGTLSNSEASARFRRFMAAARRGIGPEGYFLASWGMLAEAIGVVDACRIAMDANPTWAGIRMQLVESARWFHTQRILFLNDPDHICARTDLTWLKSVTSLVALSGSLFMLSDPLPDYTDERLAIIRKNLPTLTTMAAETGPLDLTYPAFTWTKLHGFAVNSQEKPVQAEGVALQDALDMAGIYPTMGDAHPLSSLWCFHIDLPCRRWAVVGRFATTPLPACKVPLAHLGLDPETEYLAFDFWAQHYLGRVPRHLDGPPLALGACQILALVPCAKAPQLLASSRHVSMDAISLRDMRWAPNLLTLDIASVPGTTETYWFHAPAGYGLQSVRASQATAEWRQDGELIKVDIGFMTRETRLELAFVSG